MCFNCVLTRVFVVVYCVWYVLCCCLHGVIKHDDDDDDNSTVKFTILPYLSCPYALVKFGGTRPSTFSGSVAPCDIVSSREV